MAIGRSANDIWEGVILEKISDPDTDIQIEAIKTSGELEIESAKDHLIKCLSNSLPEEEIHMQAIWALSKIGGKHIQELFETMVEESKDEEEIELLEMAIDNLVLSNGMPSFNLFN